ncbi:hypothetical protein CDAR_579911 [Caerostris darwini]|uniref:Uncharacterized protein n=1 Tax=Caerostris darwini TaxID=1538125 RepID=A0AAV4MX13_9ARAC|nr:hypothetical protein CDAR_579911 [Caerostris darwini]
MDVCPCPLTRDGEQRLGGHRLLQVLDTYCRSRTRQGRVDSMKGEFQFLVSFPRASKQFDNVIVMIAMHASAPNGERGVTIRWTPAATSIGHLLSIQNQTGMTGMKTFLHCRLNEGRISIVSFP